MQNRDGDAHETLRKMREDKVLGIFCGNCGHEPADRDRRKSCEKCLAHAWETKESKLADLDDEE